MSVQADISLDGVTYGATLGDKDSVVLTIDGTFAGFATWARKRIDCPPETYPKAAIAALTVKLKIAFLGSRVKSSMFKAPKTTPSEAIKLLTLPDAPEGCLKTIRVKGQHFYTAFLLPHGELILCRNANTVGKGLWNPEEGAITSYIGAKMPDKVWGRITEELSKT